MVFSSNIINVACLIAMAAGWLVGCSRMQKNPPLEAEQPPMVDLILNDFPQQEDVEDPPDPVKDPVVHKVKWQRETLFSISLWYTGSGNNWRRLAEANPNIKPRRIRIGNSIIIPEALLKTRQPMPAGHIRPLPGKKSTTPRQSPEPSSKVDTPPLYGPIISTDQTKTNGKDASPVPLEVLD